MKLEMKLKREKRNCNDVTKKELHNILYIIQKRIVQTKIREQMNIII